MKTKNTTGTKHENGNDRKTQGDTHENKRKATTKQQ